MTRAQFLSILTAPFVAKLLPKKENYIEFYGRNSKTELFDGLPKGGEMYFGWSWTVEDDGNGKQRVIIPAPPENVEFVNCSNNDIFL